MLEKRLQIVRAILQGTPAQNFAPGASMIAKDFPEYPEVDNKAFEEWYWRYTAHNIMLLALELECHT
jgi:hypothetical protein